MRRSWVRWRSRSWRAHLPQQLRSPKRWLWSEPQRWALPVSCGAVFRSVLMFIQDPGLHDPFRLERFVQAQSGVYSRVLQELRSGEKRSHWMWFIFPQIAGLGSSEMAQRFAISGRSEALAYLAHPVLGPRLHQCTGLVNAASPNRRVEQIFGYPDDLKFRSSITLFQAV